MFVAVLTIVTCYKFSLLLLKLILIDLVVQKVKKIRLSVHY